MTLLMTIGAAFAARRSSVERLLAPVAHRQVVLTLPKRLRAYFVQDRRRLGLLSQVAARTLRAYVQATLGEHEAVPGVIACVQTFGSVAHHARGRQ